MSKVSFEVIGFANRKKTKAGVDAISVELIPYLLPKIKHDDLTKIWIFKNNRKIYEDEYLIYGLVQKGDENNVDNKK